MNQWEQAWITRWERAWELGEERNLGPKGQAYIEKTYGREVEPEDEPEDYYDDYDSYDLDIEY